MESSIYYQKYHEDLIAVCKALFNRICECLPLSLDKQDNERLTGQTVKNQIFKRLLAEIDIADRTRKYHLEDGYCYV